MQALPQPSGPLHELHPAAETESKFNELGLKEEYFAKAAELAYAEVERCTGNDVAAMSRFTGWGKVLRHLRDELIPLGWSKGRQPHLESVVSPDGTFRILSVGGNAATGTDKMPATLRDKGPLTGFAVDDNRQIMFDPDIVGAVPESEMLTYFFLHYPDWKAEQIRLELSVPTHLAGKKKTKRAVVDQFGPRIPIRPVLLDSAAAADAAAADAELSDEIDVPVARRSS